MELIVFYSPCIALIFAFAPVILVHHEWTDYGLAKWFDLRWVIPVQIIPAVVSLILWIVWTFIFAV